MKKIISQVTLPFLNFLILISCIFNFIACTSEIGTNSSEEELSLSEAEIVLNLVNEARSDAGLDTLVLNTILNEVAFEHSSDMQTNNYFSHIGLNGSSFSGRAIDAGYTGAPLGENIAKGQRTATTVFNSWFESSGHKANMLNANATEMGIGVSGVYWTQIFGKESSE